MLASSGMGGIVSTRTNNVTAWYRRRQDRALNLFVAPIAVTAVLLSGSCAFAKKRSSDVFSLSGYYSQYTNAGVRDASIKHPAPSADIEVAIRVLSLVSLAASMSNSIEPDPTDIETQQERIRTLGGGIKVDLPGFFLLGTRRSDLMRWSKSDPFNLFAIGEALVLETKDVVTYNSTLYTAGRFGLGLDIFPFTELSHFTLRCLYMNFANNGYMVYSFGGGIVF